MTGRRLVVVGAGFSGLAIAREAAAAGWTVSLTSRTPSRTASPPGVDVIGFESAAPVIARATHLVSTAAPGEAGDPVFYAHAKTVGDAPGLVWAGYLSTTGVYGDRGGGWVDEHSPPAPGSARARRRLEAEEEWAALAPRIAVDLFRTAGIYGPGRSALDDVRSGRARRIDKPGHEFGRIHRDDIAGAVLAAAAQRRDARGINPRVLHLADDTPAPSAEVIAEAARLLGKEPPPLVPYDTAVAGMSEMARSFWAENRRVASAKTQAWLGRRWRYPSYREGLAAILAEEALHRPA